MGRHPNTVAVNLGARYPTWDCVICLRSHGDSESDKFNYSRTPTDCVLVPYVSELNYLCLPVRPGETKRVNPREACVRVLGKFMISSQTQVCALCGRFRVEYAFVSLQHVSASGR